MSHVEPYYVSTVQAELDIPWVIESLMGTHWGTWLTPETISRAVKRSLCFGLYERRQPGALATRDRQIGFARIVTDGTTFSSMMDVFIDPTMRNRGLGKFLVATVLSHVDVAGTINVISTRDAQRLYKKFGYVAIEAMKRIPGK